MCAVYADDSVALAVRSCESVRQSPGSPHRAAQLAADAGTLRSPMIVGCVLSLRSPRKGHAVASAPAGRQSNNLCGQRFPRMGCPSHVADCRAGCLPHLGIHQRTAPVAIVHACRSAFCSRVSVRRRPQQTSPGAADTHVTHASETNAILGYVRRGRVAMGDTEALLPIDAHLALRPRPACEDRPRAQSRRPRAARARRMRRRL